MEDDNTVLKIAPTTQFWNQGTACGSVPAPHQQLCWAAKETMKADRAGASCQQ